MKQPRKQPVFFMGLVSGCFANFFSVDDLLVRSAYGPNEKCTPSNLDPAFCACAEKATARSDRQPCRESTSKRHGEEIVWTAH